MTSYENHRFVQLRRSWEVATKTRGARPPSPARAPSWGADPLRTLRFSVWSLGPKLRRHHGSPCRLIAGGLMAGSGARLRWLRHTPMPRWGTPWTSTRASRASPLFAWRIWGERGETLPAGLAVGIPKPEVHESSPVELEGCADLSHPRAPSTSGGPSGGAFCWCLQPPRPVPAPSPRGRTISKSSIW